MVQVLKGNIVQAPALGELQITEQGYLVMEDGVIRGVYDRLPLEYATAPLVDYGQALVMQSFADMHLHAPQYPMLGMGMDLPLLEWLDTYTFPTEARFADTDYARRIYRRLAPTRSLSLDLSIVRSCSKRITEPQLNPFACLFKQTCVGSRGFPILLVMGAAITVGL